MVLSRVSHPNVVRYVAHGVTDLGERFLAMAWLEGEDLHALLRAGPLGVESTVALVHGAAKGIAAVHALGIVHRDLKPRNLVIPGGDVARVRLLDFGIARPAELEALVERMLSKDRAMGAASTTRREQRVCCAVLAASNDRVGDASWRRELEVIASATGQDARVESLVESSSLVVMTGDGAASDLAARACRCALALNAVAPGLTPSVSTGRGEDLG